MDYVTDFKEETFDRCAIFALSPRITASDTCYYCPGPDLDDCKTTTMNSGGRKTYTDGLKGIDSQDDILKACLAPRSKRVVPRGISKLMCLVVNLSGAASGIKFRSARLRWL